MVTSKNIHERVRFTKNGEINGEAVYEVWDRTSNLRIGDVWRNKMWGWKATGMTLGTDAETRWEAAEWLLRCHEG